MRRPLFQLVSLAQELPAAEPAQVWLGPEGATLPFRSAAEVEEFLRGAKVVKVYRKKLYGVTKPLKVLVQNGNVKAHAVFRSYHREEENAHWESGQFTEFLRDTYLSEIAAHQLTRLLGLDTVPPAVPWQLKKQRGSLQIWIEKARPGWHPHDPEQPNDPDRWQAETGRMLIFDALIGNIDRHESNVLVDSAGKVWWIDHSRSFGRERELSDPDQIRRCERAMWEGLTAVDPKMMAERLAPYMSPREVDALLERHRRLTELIRQRIAEQGEAAVLYTIEPGPPLQSVRRVR